MSDRLIIAFLAAGCFVLWLFLQRRKSAPTAPAATLDAGWFAPSDEYDDAAPGSGGVSTAPSPASSAERDYNFIATAVLSPAWHNENGWPAVAVEYFPLVAAIKTESIRLTAIVRALYEGPNLPDKELSETISSPPEVMLRSLHASGRRLKASFEIGAGITERARQDLPPEYNQIAKSVSVDIRLELTGRSA